MSVWLKLLHRWAASAGYNLSPLPPKSERLEIHLGRLFAQQGINCVLDVGANRGQYGRFLRQWGYKGKIISFEPVTADYRQLETVSAADPNWLTYQYALGEAEKSAEINVTSDSLFNSFLPPNDFIKGQGLRVDQTEKVQVRTLDNVLDEVLSGDAQSKPYLKLDTQGYDHQVLAGAQQVLNRIVALQVELSVKAVYEGMPYYLDSIALLEDKGYEVTGLYPIARDNALRVVEFDCVMVQTAIAGETTAIFPP